MILYVYNPYNSVYTIFFHSRTGFHNIVYSAKNASNGGPKTPENQTPKVTKIGGVFGKMRTKVADLLYAKEDPNWTPGDEIQKPLQEYLNIPRKNIVASIGDLHGNYGALLGNLGSIRAINNSQDWIGGDIIVVSHGDIFADRHGHSMDIASYSAKLRIQARLHGGDIIFLGGNHEDIAFAYLTGQPIYHKGKWRFIGIDSFKSAINGLIELESYADTVENMGQKKLLQILHEDSKGYETLSFMCDMKLISQIDDTLRIHVLPHPTMLRLITKVGIDTINALYQKGMRYYLLGEGTLSPIEKTEFMNLRKIFLDTDHRKTQIHDTYKDIKAMGINLIISGHDTNNSGEITDYHGVICTGVDFGYGMLTTGNQESGLKKRDLGGRKKSSKIWLANERRNPDRHTSTLVLGKDGSMMYGNGDTYRI